MIFQFMQLDKEWFLLLCATKLKIFIWWAIICEKNPEKLICSKTGFKLNRNVLCLTELNVLFCFFHSKELHYNEFSHRLYLHSLALTNSCGELTFTYPQTGIISLGS